MDTHDFVIRMLRSVEHEAAARRFAREHAVVLERFGVGGVPSARPTWQADPGTFMFVAEDAGTGDMVAGMRLDVESDGRPIPMAAALRPLSQEFNDLIDTLRPLGLAEGCAWWVKEGYAGRGLPGILLRAGVSVAPRLGVSYVVGFPHQHTKSIMSRYGFIAVDVLGDNGSFVYPDERYRSTVVELNVRTLHTTPRAERQWILALRDDPEQDALEGELSLRYRLGGGLSRCSGRGPGRLAGPGRPSDDAGCETCSRAAAS
jgi:hypothetical protein